MILPSVRAFAPLDLSTCAQQAVGGSLLPGYLSSATGPGRGGAAFRSGLLAFVSALGLGLPSVVAGLLDARTSRAVGFVRRHQTVLMRTGGILMVVVGLLLVTGRWTTTTADLRQSFATSTPPI